MKRKHFLALAAGIAWAVGILMLTSPIVFLRGLPDTNPIAELLTRMLGAQLITIGIIDYTARNAHWSTSLRAIMAGNIMLHLMAMGLEAYGFAAELVGSSTVAMGVFTHSLLAVGFLSYFFVPSLRDADASAQPAR